MDYSLDELGMTISMPADYVVFTRDINDNDPNLSTYGLTKDSLSSYLDEDNVYLYGWDKNVNESIIITMDDSTLADLNLYSDTKLSTMFDSYKSQYEDSGITSDKLEIYQHSQAKFSKIYASQPEDNFITYVLKYHTVYAHKSIDIIMRSYSGKISSEQEATLKGMVDSVIFDTAPCTPTNSFTYTDTNTQTTFTVPENWVETSLSEDKAPYFVQFSSLIESGAYISYGSADAWKDMTIFERIWYNRSDVNNRMLTKSKFADLCGLSSENISLVTYGGTEYYKAVIPAGTEIDGQTSTNTVTYLVLLKNGYVYFLQFVGANDGEAYKDFESLLSSVQIAGYDNQTSTTNSGSNGLMKRLYGNLLFSLLITIAVYSLPIVIYRYAIRRAPVDRKKAKKITIIYGICAVIIMAVIYAVFSEGGKVGSAVVFWSYINYLILVSGKRPASFAVETTRSDYSENTERY